MSRKSTLAGGRGVIFQERLVSGVNIKTINGNNILGSGNVAAGGGSFSGTMDDINDGIIYVKTVNSFSDAEQSKLYGIEAGANNYIHPTNHHPSIIIQDVNNRFVTDIEKSTWNGKSNLALGETSNDAYRGDRGKAAYDHSQLAHAPSNAEANVNPDWNASSGDSQILNKPDLSSLHSHSNKTLLDAIQEALTTILKNNYDTAYSHSQTSHAPSNAQKNSDITKAEIEAKLIGEISSHTHAGGGGGITLAQARQLTRR